MEDCLNCYSFALFKFKGYKNAVLLNQKQDDIDNLTNVVLKLEKSLRNYKKNAEKKFLAQNEIHSQELKKKKDSFKRLNPILFQMKKMKNKK